ncbi:MAG: nucleoside-diphosphate kinase [Patescibacteria group bacterium]
MKPETFQDIEIPQVFSSRRLAKETMIGLQEGSSTLNELEQIKLAKIVQVLQHQELQTLIDEGKITLGIVKPHANEGKNLPEDDDEAAQVLLTEIGDENIVFTFSTQLTGDQVEKFYGGVKEKYSQITDSQGQTIWDTIYNFGQSGPLTFILIYREEGNAVEWWRNKMGKTRPNEADPQSIRGRFALQEGLPNNLTHGSDSSEAVKKEIGVLRTVVADTLRLSNNNSTK